MKRIFAMLTFVMALAANVAAQDADAKYAAGLLKPGTVAPDFTLAAPDGTKHSLSSLKGNYVVLDFWASWCPDCRKDIPAMKELHDKYGQNVKFVSVSFDDNRQNWITCIEKNDMDWLHLSELKKWKQTRISKLYKIQWIPAMYLIDAQGHVAMATVMVEKLAAKLHQLTAK